MSAAKISKPVEELQKMTCEVLKEMCRNRGLKVSGNKSELVARLAPVAAAPAAAAAAADSDDDADEEKQAEPRGFEQLKAVVLQLETADLFKMEKQILAEIERRTKGATAGPRVSRPMNEGCQKYQLWCQFVQAHGIKNGWEAFTYAKRCKMDGEMKTVEVDAEAGVEHDGQFIHRDTVTKQKPHGETLTLSQAMRLAKQYWSAKEQKGTKPELYQQFESTLESGSEIEVVAKQVKQRRTMAQLREEQTAAKKAKEVEHAALMAANKAKREAEREERNTAKAAEKALFAAIKPKAAKKEKKEWTCPDDDLVHAFEFEGQKLLRNFAGHIWQDANGELGAWVGTWDAAAKNIAAIANPFGDE
ncbi:MAG: hypothetical protein EBT09_06260 [Actinobacteria bacterium]|nr:hypothetical protein [Actinomycetota bacterium]